MLPSEEVELAALIEEQRIDMTGEGISDLDGRDEYEWLAEHGYKPLGHGCYIKDTAGHE